MEQSSTGIIGKILNFITNSNIDKANKKLLLAYKFIDELKLEAVPQSNFILLSYEDKDPKFASDFINTLIDVYLEIRAEQESSFSKNVLDFFNKQVDRTRKELEQAENNLKEFTQKYKLADLNLQKKHLIETISNLKQKLMINKSQETGLLAQIQFLKSEIKTLSKYLVTSESNQINPLLTEIDKQILNLKVKYDELATKYNLNDYQLKELKKRIDKLEKLKEQKPQILLQTVTESINPIWQDANTSLQKLTLQYENLKVQNQKLQELIDELETQLSQLSEKEIELNTLKREVDNIQKRYIMYLNKREEALIEQEKNKTGLSVIKVIERAFPPIKPIKPNLIFNLFISGFLGILFGLSISIIYDIVKTQK